MKKINRIMLALLFAGVFVLGATANADRKEDEAIKAIENAKQTIAKSKSGNFSTRVSDDAKVTRIKNADGSKTYYVSTPASALGEMSAAKCSGNCRWVTTVLTKKDGVYQIVDGAPETNGKGSNAGSALREGKK